MHLFYYGHQDRLCGVADIAYTDLKDGEDNGYLRCTDTEGAKKISAAKIDGHTFSLLTGIQVNVHDRREVYSIKRNGALVMRALCFRVHDVICKICICQWKWTALICITFLLR